MRKKKKLTGEIFEKIEITDIGAEGKAISRINEQVLFIPFGAPGDIVDVKITNHRRRHLEGRIVNMHKKSDLRVTPFCEHFTVCGGCKWQHLDYSRQLKYKQKQVTDNLQRIGNIKYQYNIHPIVPSYKQQFYRNKLEYTFSNQRWLYNEDIKKSDKIENPEGLGFHVPKFFDKVVDINKCWLQPEPSNEIRLAVKEYAVKNNLSFFNIKKQEGFLRNIIIRNNLKGEFMVILVVFNNEKKQIIEILDFLHSRFSQIKSLYYIINSKKNDSIGDLDPVLYKGEPYLTEAIDDLVFKIGPKSFFQTNSEQATILYRITSDFACLTGNEMLYDLYTGTGTIANYLAKKSKRVTGIENIDEAVEHARENAILNNIDNVDFICGDMVDVFNEELFAKYGKPDVIITDPPRAGMHPKVIDKISISGARRIVYVSCNPATQARDIELLAGNYNLISINPVDMFPHSQHVENVAVLELR